MSCCNDLKCKISRDAFCESNLVFWSRQLNNHVFFLYLMLTDKDLKQKALHLQVKWEKFREIFPQGELKFKICQDLIDQFNCLNTETADFELALLVRLTDCVCNSDYNHRPWIGWIYPTFLEHLIRLARYAHAKVNHKKLNKKCQVGFWNIINLENALLIAHLLDPSEYHLIKHTYTLADKFEKECPDKHGVRKSLEHAQCLYEFIKKLKCLLNRNEVRTIINPILLTSIIKQVQRSIKTFEKIECLKDPHHHLCKNVCKNFFDNFSHRECNKEFKNPKALEISKDCSDESSSDDLYKYSESSESSSEDQCDKCHKKHKDCKCKVTNCHKKPICCKREYDIVTVKCEKKVKKCDKCKKEEDSCECKKHKH